MAAAAMAAHRASFPLRLQQILAGSRAVSPAIKVESEPVVGSVKWLEDELELNALHNPGSRRGNGNENSAFGQRTALSAALGGRVEVAAMSTISGEGREA